MELEIYHRKRILMKTNHNREVGEEKGGWCLRRVRNRYGVEWRCVESHKNEMEGYKEQVSLFSWEWEKG